MSGNCRLVGMGAAGKDAEHHGQVNEHADEESDSTCRLGHRVNGVDDGVHHPGGSEDAEEGNGHRGARIDAHVGQADGQERYDVLQIVQMGSSNSFNAFVSPHLGIDHSGIFGIGEHLVADTLARRQERHEQHFQTHEGSVEAKRCKNWILRRVQVSHFD